MASKLTTFLGGLFGGGGGQSAEAARGEGIDYNGFTIHPASRKDGSQWRTEGFITKEFEDGVKEHHFIRADMHASKGDADACSVTKGQRIIDESGDKIFKDED